MSRDALSLTVVTALAVVIAAHTTYAQTIADRSPVSVVFDGGLAAGSPGAGPAIGGRITFDVNDRLAIEGSGSWASRGSGADAAALTASLLVNLTRADRKAVPYAAVGGGVYRATFDMGDRRFLGMIGPEYAGAHTLPIADRRGVGMMQGHPTAGSWTGPWSGPTWDVSEMPMFYLQRIGAMQVPADGRWGMRHFSDPALSLGGGVRMDVTKRVCVRPELRALILMADGRSSTTGLFTLGIGYRF